MKNIFILATLTLPLLSTANQFNTNPNSSKITSYQNMQCNANYIAGIDDAYGILSAKRFTDNITIQVYYITKLPKIATEIYIPDALEAGFSDNELGLQEYIKRRFKYKSEEYGFEENSHFILPPPVAKNNLVMYLPCSTSNNKEGFIESLFCGNSMRNFQYNGNTGKFQYSELGAWIYSDSESHKQKNAPRFPSYIIYGYCREL